MNSHVNAVILATLVSATLPGCHSHRSPDEKPAESLVSTDTTTQSGVEATVYKTASCGCCKKWIQHLHDNGFKVTAHDVKDVTPIKTENKVPAKLASCHTALIGGYVIEGHVPADLIHRLLKERPAVKGLAVPDMPVGSPGMEGMFSQDYDVLTFDDQGATTVFAKR